jgi:hypothetical protein
MHWVFCMHRPPSYPSASPTQDPYDKQRPALKKQIILDGNTWVSRYARGGNVRKVSARAFYVAVDSLQVEAAISAVMSTDPPTTTPHHLARPCPQSSLNREWCASAVHRATSRRTASRLSPSPKCLNCWKT